MFTRTLALPLSLLAVSASAFKILAPGPEIWWVANSQNQLVWECRASDVLPNYTVFAGNPTLFASANVSLIAQLDNTQCSHNVLEYESVPLKAGTGYKLYFVNPSDPREVHGESDEFEVKAQGAPYSTVTATPPPAAGATSATTSGGTQPSQTGTKTGAAFKAGSVGVGKVVALVGAVAGAVAFLA